MLLSILSRKLLPWEPGEFNGYQPSQIQTESQWEKGLGSCGELMRWDKGCETGH